MHAMCLVLTACPPSILKYQTARHYLRPTTVYFKDKTAVRYKAASHSNHSARDGFFKRLHVAASTARCIPKHWKWCLNSFNRDSLRPAYSKSRLWDLSTQRLASCQKPTSCRSMWRDPRLCCTASNVKSLPCPFKILYPTSLSYFAPFTRANPAICAATRLMQPPPPVSGYPATLIRPPWSASLTSTIVWLSGPANYNRKLP